MPTPSREQQQRARIFGVFFALTFVTSIAGRFRFRVNAAAEAGPESALVEPEVPVQAGDG